MITGHALIYHWTRTAHESAGCIKQKTQEESQKPPRLWLAANKKPITSESFLQQHFCSETVPTADDWVRDADKEHSGRQGQPGGAPGLHLTYAAPAPTVPFQLNAINLHFLKWQGVGIATFALSNEKQGEINLLKIKSCCSVAQSCPTLRTAPRQASLSLTISWSLPKFMFIALVMLSSHLILWCPLLLCPQSFPTSGIFPIFLTGYSYQVTKILELQHQSFWGIFRVDLT